MRSAHFAHRLAFVLAAALSVSAFATSDDPAFRKLKGESIAKHIETLASAEYEGRGAGTPGGEKAIEYVVKQFEAIGLAPKGTAGFRQPFKGRKYSKLANVVGLLEGSDDELKKEFVVIGAHHDHLGKKGDKIWYGADDNASGVGTVLEIAKLVKETGAPKRSILFVTFDGEETGLVGSRYFVKEPPVAKESIVAMINFDMVSRGDPTHVCVCGTTESPELLEFVKVAGPLADIDLDFTHEKEWRTASDHGSFANAGIPFLYFGVEDHEDYHKPTDTADKVMQGKLERIARLGYLTLIEAANAEKRPTYVKPKG